MGSLPGCREMCNLLHTDLVRCQGGSQALAQAGFRAWAACLGAMQPEMRCMLA